MDDRYEIIDLTPNYGRSRFSRVEIRDILISVIVLSLAFTLMMMRGNWKYSDVGLLFLIFYALSFVIITLSFIPHEMGHKFVAQKYGAWSEYRKSNNGLIFAVLISLLGKIGRAHV